MRILNRVEIRHHLKSFGWIPFWRLKLRKTITEDEPRPSFFIDCNFDSAVRDYRVVMILIMLITAFLCLLSSINAYRTGAPAEVCKTMMPNHGVGVTSQTSVAPYNISVEPMSYSNGTTVTVTLTGLSTTFKGYLLTMKRVDNQAFVAGFSVLNDGKLSMCDDQNNAAVTHTENLNKMSVNFTWTAPAQSVGTLQAVATIVQNKTTFWTMIQSPAITASSSTTTTAGCVLGILGAVVMTVLIL